MVTGSFLAIQFPPGTLSYRTINEELAPRMPFFDEYFLLSLSFAIITHLLPWVFTGYKVFKGHSRLWDRADLDTSFLTLKRVHPNLKSKHT